MRGFARTLVTVIDISECHTTITVEWMQKIIEQYNAVDDAFQSRFLQGVIFCGHQPSKFVSAFHRNNNDRSDRNLQEVDPSGDNYGHINIAVPSRLRSFTSNRLPLSGFRIGVKDNFDLEGTKTSLCSRSYLQTYPKKTQSAPCIQELLDLGVSIVGKTKLCAFAQWEEPTEAVEYTSPWSARADGFQSSGGSSNGSGAAVAAYEWLDITIGSDSKLHSSSTLSDG
ncbi:MAG: hypothetical protein Q9216_003830 [Gyalolechia sp. 2 TL-2023]